MVPDAQVELDRHHNAQVDAAPVAVVRMLHTAEETGHYHARGHELAQTPAFARIRV